MKKQCQSRADFYYLFTDREKTFEGGQLPKIYERDKDTVFKKEKRLKPAILPKHSKCKLPLKPKNKIQSALKFVEKANPSYDYKRKKIGKIVNDQYFDTFGIFCRQ